MEGLRAWFQKEGKAYPWGTDPNPYRVWVSEVMLQQTIVSVVIPYFERWMEKFPDVKTLARAEEQEVLRCWQGLGYYSRGRNLLKAARLLKQQNLDLPPGEYKALLTLPGVGDYTARAVLSLAYGQLYPVLDANVRRIVIRLQGWKDSASLADRDFYAFLDERIFSDAPGMFNAALMQLGQLVCLKKNPRCEVCPLEKDCQARAEGIQNEIPPVQKRSYTLLETRLLLLSAGGSLLLRQKQKGRGQKQWFFPEGGKAFDAAFQFGDPARKLKERKHFYTRYKDTLQPELHFFPKQEKEALLVFFQTKYPRDVLSWVADKALKEYPRPAVYEKIIDEYLDLT